MELARTAAGARTARLAFGIPGGVGSWHDHNRDGRIDMADAAVARANLLRRLPMLNVAPAPQAAPQFAPVSERTAYAAPRRADLLDVEAASVL
jgi:hypothetical protein